MRDKGLGIAIALGIIVFGLMFAVTNGFSSPSLGVMAVHVDDEAPTVNDDIDRGYGPGWYWIDQSAPAIYVAVTTGDGAADWNQVDSVGGAGLTVRDEALDLTVRTFLNFEGAGVTCIDDAGDSETQCTIPGGGAQDLAGVLSTGNTSGGTDIVMSGAGDTVNFTRTLSLVLDALTQTTGTGTAQIPDLGGTTDQFVFEDLAQTFTNKTINDAENSDVRANALHIFIRNESGGTIVRGDVVFISGYSVGQDLPLVTLADASSSATMPTIGVVEDTSILNNASGSLTVAGRLVDLDTSAFSVGDVLFVSNVGTTTNTLTATQPTGTDLIQKIGEVLRDHASNGVLEIFGAGRTNGIPNLADDSVWQGNSSGVATATAVVDCNASNIDRLQYDTTANVWSCVTALIDISDDTNLVAGTGATLTGDSLSVDLGTSIDVTSEITGIVPVANGGTGQISATEDTVLMGNTTAFVTVAIPDCQDSGGNHLNFNSTTDAWDCGTTGAAGAIETQEGDVQVTASATVLDFGPGFDLTDSPAGETNVVLDLTENQVDVTTEIIGIIPVGNGGTGTSIITANEVIVGLGTAAVTTVNTGTSGFVLTSNGAAAPTWQAGGGGSSIADGRPERAAETYFTIPGLHSINVQTTTLSANILFYLPIDTPTEITLDRLVINVTTAAVITATARLGLYTADDDWQPDVLVLDAGTVEVDSTGVKAITIAETIPAGRYLLAIVSDSEITLRSVNGTGVSQAYVTGLTTNIFLLVMANLSGSGEHTALSDPGLGWDLSSLANSPMKWFVWVRVSVP